MLLAINIGNTNITCGGYARDGKLAFSAKLFADSALSSDELVYKLVNMLELYGGVAGWSWTAPSWPAWCRR